MTLLALLPPRRATQRRYRSSGRYYCITIEMAQLPMSIFIDQRNIM